MKILIGAIILLLMSCASSKNVIEEQNNTSLPIESPFTLLMTEHYGAPSPAQNIVISDSKTLNSFFSKVNRTRKPGIPVPDIDFLKNVIIIVYSGETLNHADSVLYVLKETVTQIVLSTKLRPSKKENSTRKIINSFYMYIMPQSKKEIIIINKE